METVQRGKVYLVGAGPGDPGLITLRGLACLAQADVVVHDRLVSCQLVDFALHAERIDVGKQPNHHPVPQEEINAILIEKARAGKVVVRLKGGDPFIFGRGGEEALALVEAGIPFDVVPGVTSAIAAPAYAGIPVTQRGIAGSVAFVTAHRAAECNDLQEEIQWEHLAQGVDTLIFLMGVHNLPVVVGNLLANGRPADTPVAIVEQGTHATQRVVVGTLANILERSAEVRPPAVTIVGEVVRLRGQLAWFEGEQSVLPDSIKDLMEALVQ